MRLFKVSHIASKLNISPHTIFDILSKNGYEFMSGLGHKINEEQLDVLIADLSIDLDLQKWKNFTIRINPAGFERIRNDIHQSFNEPLDLSDFDTEIIDVLLADSARYEVSKYVGAKYDHLLNLRRYLKRVVKGFKAKTRFYNLKYLIQTIFNPCLYYTFSTDEDEKEKFPSGASLSLN